MLTSEAELAEFRDPFAHATWDDYTASAVVMPTTVEEIQAVLRVANEHKVPLWTHGQGRNNGYGGPAPRVRGSVIVSLRNMNRVLEINEECAYAVVEPGVRWFDLYDAIQAGGHKLWLSIADLGWGSVIGNTLDHGVTYLPYGQDMAAQCGMEVVLANGDVLRTGMGAMPDNKSWHLYKRGLGPTPDQLFMQSNYGIVTKMGVWLMPQPQTYMPFWVRVWKEDDLGAGGRHAAQAAARRHDRGRAVALQHALPRLGALEPLAVVRRRGADPGRGHRSHRARARDRPLDHPLRAVGRRGGRRPPLREDQGGLRADPRRRGVGDEARPRDGRDARAPGRSDPGGRAQPRLEQHDRAGTAARRAGTSASRRSRRSPAATRSTLRDLLRGLIEERAGLDYIAANLAVSARSFAHVTLIIFDTKNEAQARARLRHGAGCS